MAVNRLAGGVVFAALVIAGTQLVLGGERTLGLAAFAAAGVSLVWVLAGRRA
jgi:hypothetical protein